MQIFFKNFYLLKTAQCLIDEVVAEFQRKYSTPGGLTGVES